MTMNFRSLVAAIILAFGVADMASALEVTAGGTGFRNSRGEQKWLTYRDNVEKASGGKIKMKMLIYGELGGEENLVAGIRRGRVHVANWSGAVATTVVPELALLYAPYLFDNYAEADFVMDNYLYAAYAKLFAEKDIYFLTWDEIGFGQVWSKTPIILPEDAKSRRFRVSSSDAAQMLAQSLKADVIPLAFTDIVSSLQTGLIDAGETAVTMYVRSGIAGDAKHVTMTDHNFATSVIVLRKSWLEGLPADQRKIMTESQIPMATSRQWTREEVIADLAQAKERGFTIHTLTPEQRNRWREATSGVTKQLIDKIGGNAQKIWDVAQEGKKAYAAQIKK
jgi:TRAP-type transport system periplasmic protein